ncbi:MAG: ferrous iron transporter B [Bdellovibrionota bacterium]
MSSNEKGTLLLLGNPNSGKTLLFNRLTGLRKKVANFPGVTVELATGWSTELGLELVDFPGIYSLTALTRDEEVAVQSLQHYLQSPKIRGVVCVLDVTRLERSLFLALQLQQECVRNKHPILFVLNMMDQIIAHKIRVDTQMLQDRLGVPVVEISAKTRKGFQELQIAIEKMVDGDQSDVVPLTRNTNQLKALAKDLSNKAGLKGDLMLRSQYRIDRIILSHFWGLMIFCFTMIFLFQAIFSWSAPLMDGVQSIVSWLAQQFVPLFGKGVAADFVRDAVFSGFGSFLVFAPQIFVLTLIIGFLEDSGYLARAALICHRPLSFFGLSGKSFVPLLTGHACAIPAIFASRTIESPKKRLLTMIVVPLTVCSARLPVYGLLIATLIPAHTYLGGLVGLQGMTFFALYLFGIVTALLVSGVLQQTLLRNTSDAPFILELPPYRLPNLFSILRKSWDRALSFVTRAGPTIFAVAVVIWALGYFPSRGELDHSYLASMGKWIEPAFKPLGLDWKFGVAILMSFLAREVFVGTLGTMLGIAGADKDFHGLADQLHSSGLTLASGLALLVFYAIAMQCVATLAVLRKELGSWKIPALLFLGYSLLAYLAAFTVYTIAN